MLKPSDQQDVWEGLISSSTRASCFGDLCVRYNAYNKALVWVTLFLSWSAASVVVKDWLPPNRQGWRFAFAVIVAGTSFLSVLQQYQKRSSDCLDLYYKWNNIATRFDALWNDMYADDASNKLEALKKDVAEVSKSSVPFGRHTRLMLKCQTEIEKRYETAAISATA